MDKCVPSNMFLNPSMNFVQICELGENDDQWTPSWLVVPNHETQQFFEGFGIPGTYGSFVSGFLKYPKPKVIKKSKEPSHIGLNPIGQKVLATWATCCARPRPFLIYWHL